MSGKLALALVMAIPAAGLVSLAHTADAATVRWQDVTFTPTLDDGVAVTGAYYQGDKILDTLTTPYFTFNDTRYELSDSYRTFGPTTNGDDGVFRIEAGYEVPVAGGTAAVLVTHTFVDRDAQYSDLGELTSRVSFDGPEGDYQFFWRIDPDLRGAAGDRVQVFTEIGHKGAWQAPTEEEGVPLNGSMEFGRFKVRFNDGPDYAHQTQLRLAAQGDGVDQAYIVRAVDGEWELDPADLVNGDKIQTVQSGVLLPQPILGSDLVVWYTSRLSGTHGETGPALYASKAEGRQAVLEVDRMPTTELPPPFADHNGDPVSFESAFGKAGITINGILDDGLLPDAEKLSIAELDAVMEANADYQESQDTPTQWYSWFGIARNLSIPGVLGIMYDYEVYSSDEAYREGAFGFYDALIETLPLLEQVGYPPQDPELYLLWTMTHESGHAYNQHHEDWYYNDTSCFYENSAIMGYSYDANTMFWDFGPNSNASMRGGDPDEYVRPGHGVDFIRMQGPGFYPYNTTRAHKQGHNQTQQFSGGGC